MPQTPLTINGQKRYGYQKVPVSLFRSMYLFPFTFETTTISFYFFIQGKQYLFDWLYGQLKHWLSAHPYFYLIGKILSRFHVTGISAKVKYPAASWGWPSLFFSPQGAGYLHLQGAYICQISAQARLLASLLAGRTKNPAEQDSLPAAGRFSGIFLFRRSVIIVFYFIGNPK